MQHQCTLQAVDNTQTDDPLCPLRNHLLQVFDAMQMTTHSAVRQHLCIKWNPEHPSFNAKQWRGLHSIPSAELIVRLHHALWSVQPHLKATYE